MAKSEFNLSSTMIDDQIMNEILKTHDHPEIDFDVGPLFTVVKNILNRAYAVVQNVFLLKKPENLAEAEPSTPSLGLQLCTLKQLYCEMACKPLGEETARKTTMSILKKLSKHSWHVKALLTLAAFAVDYGDFWFLAHLSQSDRSAKSVGILKGMPNIHKESWLQKHSGEIAELNKLINATLDFIGHILELEDLAVKHAEVDLPEFSKALHYIPLYVYYAIETVAACTTQMCCLFDDEGHETQELSSFSSKIKSTHIKLKFAIDQSKHIIEEKEAYQKLVKNIKIPRKIVVVFKEMHFTPLLIGSTNNEVGIEEIESKNVLLFISDLDICENDISILKNDQYKIIWIPIVEEWMQKKFENLRSKIPPTWYLLPKFSFKLGIKYIKEKWQFKNRPIVVVMSPQGNVIYPNAYYMISLGINPLLPPKTDDSKPPLPHGEDSVGLFLFGNLNQNIATWMEDEKYIFFYGGDDTQWIKQFEEKASALKKVINSIEFFLIKNGSEGEDILWKFWNRIESFFLGWNNIKSFLLSEADMKTRSFTVMSTILKLLSCKAKSSTGWVLLCKGSKLVDSGHGTIILNVLQKFEQWTPTSPLSEFESYFFNYHRQIVNDDKHACFHIDILEDAGKITEPVICPVCQDRMKMCSRFSCCHNGNLDMNAQH